MKIIRRLLLMLSLILLFIFVKVNDTIPGTIHAMGIKPERITVMYYDENSNSRGFNWVTSPSVSDGQLQIIKKNNQTSKNNVIWENATKINGTYSDFYSGHRAWKAHIQNLEYGETYFYRVGSPTHNSWSQVGELYITDGSEGVSFLHVTDPQGYSTQDYVPWVNNLDLITSQFPNINSLLVTGDLTQEYSNLNSNINEWGYALDGAKNVLMNNVITATAGNHDKAPNLFYNHFNAKIPQNCNTLDGFYHSYYIADVHVIVLNTNDQLTTSNPLSPVQLAWLENELANSTGTWKLIMIHKGLVSSGRHMLSGDVELLRKDLFPLFSKYEVDLVLQGHEHVYTRSNPYSWNADGKTPNTSYASERRIIDNYLYDFAVSPGTFYVTPNTITAATRNLSPIQPNSSLPPYYNLATSPVNGLFLNQQPNLPMFGHIEIHNGSLIYKTYLIDRDNSIVLYDYFGIVKNGVKQVEDKINALPNSYSATIRNKVADAVSAYNSLSENDKQRINTALIEKLDQLSMFVDTQQFKLSRSVVELISMIGPVTYTQDAKKRIDQAYDAYNNLSNLAKSYVENFNILVSAKDKYHDLETAKTVSHMIDNLGNISSPNDESLTAARNAYNSLTANQKAYVANYFTLVRKEAALGVYKTQ